MKQSLTPSQKLIEVKNLTVKFYGKIVAVDDVSFDIYKNQNIGLIGSNGAGKTTVIETIIGINKPTSGQIVYNIKKEEVGVQFQDSLFPQHISVKQLIDFILRSYNIKVSEEELEEMMKVFKVDTFKQKQASSLSGGQAQRLNVMLCFIHKPKFVFLDELSTGLDITTRDSFKRFIKQYCEKNDITICLISHDCNELMYLVDKLYVMHKGKIIDSILTKDFQTTAELEEYIAKKIL
ncbi:MAG: ABC transporter ATP-binding protein [Mycoplasmataceae bacterium]|jgi:ABC-2 type transport system ATP-binding protein|nr:ABC transporter ATP-binding protein [Mycoplasmataceae bacterium]